MSDPSHRPADWRTICLGKHAVIKARLGWKGLKADEYVEDGYIFLATPNLKGNSIDFENVDYISKWRYDESPEIQLRVGDVLIVKDGYTLGTSNYIRHLPRPTTVNGSIAVVRTDGDIDSEFLYHFVNGQDFQKLIASKRSGLDVPHLFQADLRKFDISLPSISEQRKIARILTTLDSLIEKAEALIAKYNAIKKGMMHDLFTRGVDAYGHLRPLQAQAPSLYKQSKLGWIPKEWEAKPLSCVIRSMQLGTNLLGGEKNDGIPLLKMGNLVHGGFSFQKLEFLKQEQLNDANSSLAQYGDFLFNTRNTLDLVGKCAVWRGELPVAAFNSNIMRIKFAAEVNDFFAGYFFETERGWAEFKRIATGTTSVAAIYSRDLAECQFLHAPLPEQMKIVSLLDAHDSHLKQESITAHKLRHIKAGLLQALLTGKVRVKVDATGEVAAHV